MGHGNGKCSTAVSSLLHRYGEQVTDRLISNSIGSLLSANATNMKM